MINWINGFDAGNKKEKYYLECRLGTFTILELKWSGDKFRFMILNLGFEVQHDKGYQNTRSPITIINNGDRMCY